MIVAEVQEEKPLAPALQSSRAVGGERSPDIAHSSTFTVEVKEAWRGGLNGGSVSALDVRLLGGGRDIEEDVAGEQGLQPRRSLRGSISCLLQSHCWPFAKISRPLPELLPLGLLCSQGPSSA